MVADRHHFCDGWPAYALSSRPPDIQRVDFLGADVAGKDRGAIRGDVDLSATHLHRVHHPTKFFQAGNGFDLMVGESETLRLGLRAAGGEVEILAVRRKIPLCHVASDEVAPFLALEIERHELRAGLIR